MFLKAKRFQFRIGSLVIVALGSFLFFLSACGGGVVSPAPQNTPGTPSAPPVAAPSPAPSPVAPSPAPPLADPTPAPPPPAASSNEIKVTLKDRDFPKEIRVKAGTKVVFVVTNLGSVQHTFEIPDFDVKSKRIDKEETIRIEWTVPDAKGKWDMGCWLTEEGFHEGMNGTLIIE